MPPSLKPIFPPLTLLVLVASLGATTLMPKAPEPTLKIEPAAIPDYQLCFPSGLRLVVQPDADLRTMSLTTVVGAGYLHDEPTHPGTAQLLERAWFRSKHQNSASVATLYAAMGTHTSTEVGPAHTLYSAVFRPQMLKSIVTLEGWRFSEPLAGIIDQDLADVRQVLKRRKVTHFDNTPLQALPALLPALFPEAHPFHSRVAPPVETFDSITRTELATFALEHYTPAKITIAITGNATVQQMVSDFSASFPAYLLKREDEPDGPIQVDACPDPTPPAGLTLPKPGTQTLPPVATNVRRPTVVLAWTVPGSFRPESLQERDALQDLHQRLSEDLNQHLNYLNQWQHADEEWNSLWCGNLLSSPDANVVGCAITLGEGQSEDDVLRRLRDRIPLGPMEKEDENAFNSRRLATFSRLLRQQDSLITQWGPSHPLALWSHHIGRGNGVQQVSAWLAASKQRDLTEYGRTYLSRNRMVKVLMTPGESSIHRSLSSPDGPIHVGTVVDWSALELQDALRNYTGESTILMPMDLKLIPEPDMANLAQIMAMPEPTQLREVTLSNGLHLWHVPLSNSYLATTTALFRGGEHQEPMPGLGWLLSRSIVTHPTGTFNELNFLGTWLNSAGGATQRVGLKGSSGNLPNLLYLLRQALEQIYIRDPAPTLHRDAWVNQLQVARRNESHWIEEISRSLWPDHPAYRPRQLKDVEALLPLKEDDIIRWRRAVYTNTNGTIVVVGGDNTSIPSQVATYLEGWLPDRVELKPAQAPAPPPPPARTVRVLAEKIPTRQSQIYLSCQVTTTAPQGETSLDLLRGTLDWKVGELLRVSQAPSYNHVAEIHSAPGGNYGLHLGTRVPAGEETTAVKILLSALDQVAKGELEPGLLASAKLHEAGEMARQTLSPGGWNSLLETTLALGHDLDWLLATPTRLASVAPEDLSHNLQPCIGHEIVGVITSRPGVTAELQAAGLPASTLDWQQEAEQLWQTEDPFGWKYELDRREHVAKQK